MIQRLDPVAVIKTANEVFSRLYAAIRDDGEMQGRGGVYVCIGDVTGAPLLVFAVGEILPEENRLRYFRNALEKVTRVALANQLAGHTLSRDSEDVSRERWIGGVMVPKCFALACSGLPGDGDEAFMVLLASGLNLLPTSNAIAYLRRNKYFEQARVLLLA